MKILQFTVVILGLAVSMSGLAAIGEMKPPNSCQQFSQNEMAMVFGRSNAGRIAAVVAQKDCHVEVSKDDSTVSFISASRTVKCVNVNEGTTIGAQCY